MPAFKETIAASEIQAFTGAASTTAEQLDGSGTGRKCAKGIWVKNLDAAINIYVGKSNVSATLGFELGPDESIFLEVEDPYNVYVVAASGTPAYSWIGH